jgi:hypothetical protein
LQNIASSGDFSRRKNQSPKKPVVEKPLVEKPVAPYHSSQTSRHKFADIQRLKSLNIGGD